MTSGEHASRENLSRGSDSSRDDSMTIGLLPAPGVAEAVAEELADTLLGLLSDYVDSSLAWNITVVRDPLTGSDLDASQVLDVCDERRRDSGWDFAICLTDLPIRSGGRIVIADISTTRQAAMISMPAFGGFLLRRRALGAVVHLVNELYTADNAQSGNREASRLASQRFLTTRWSIGRIAPIRRITHADDAMSDMAVDVRFALPKVRGHVRLLAGLVRANRPLKLIPSFRGVIAAAFATGAYSLMFRSIWKLADAFAWPRFVALMALSVVGLIVWIIIAHNLWEKTPSREAKGRARLYNAVTVITLTVSVLSSYAVLFLFLFIATVVFVPVDALQATLQHSITWRDYASLVWVASSVATIAGALGAGLEDEEVVRQAAFSYRQRRRNRPSGDSASD